MRIVDHRLDNISIEFPDDNDPGINHLLYFSALVSSFAPTSEKSDFQSTPNRMGRIFHLQHLFDA